MKMVPCLLNMLVFLDEKYEETPPVPWINMAAQDAFLVICLLLLQCLMHLGPRWPHNA